MLTGIGVLASGPPAAELKSYHFTVKDLAEPSVSAPNPPKIVPRPEGAMLTLPPGFQAEIFAENFKRPRIAVEAPNGDVFVADPSIGTVLVLHDADGNRVIDAAERSEFATGPECTLRDGVPRRAHVRRSDRRGAAVPVPRPGQLKATAAGEKIADLPHGPTGHSTRNIRFSPDGAWFYVTVGSSSDIDVDPDPLRAAVLRFKPDGSGREVVVTGTRNPVGSRLPSPDARAVDHACRNGTALATTSCPTTWPARGPGAFFGWPYAYIGAHEDPRHKGARPDLVKAAVVPDVILQAHSSVMTLAFYDAAQFPARYRGGAFVALRGSSRPHQADRLQGRVRALQRWRGRRRVRGFPRRLDARRRLAGGVGPSRWASLS